MLLKKFSKKIFSKEEQVENFILRKKYRVLGVKFSHKYSQEEYMTSEKYSKKNMLLYSDLINKLRSYKKICLYFDHSLGGGTETYFNNKLRHLNKGEVIIRVQYFLTAKCYKLSLCGACKKCEIWEISLETLVKEIVKSGIDEIIVNNIVGYRSVEDVFSAVKYLKQKNPYLKVVLMGHDYYPICPQWNLLDEKFERCKLNSCSEKYRKCCTNFDKRLVAEAAKSNNFDIKTWRNLWNDFIVNYVDEVRCFSPSAGEYFLKAYPCIVGKLKVVPHRIEPFKNALNIAILGHVTVHKGAHIIIDLLNYFRENNIWDIHFYVLGINYLNVPSNPHISFLGRYERNCLPDLLKQYHIDAIFIPSIWDETFSYTTAESIAMDYPVTCFDFGGQADQVRCYDKGFIIKSFEPADIYNALKNAASKTKVLQQ